jgi:hypothetical protein
VGALDAFMSTWNRARATFGEGTPDDGTQFDKSAQLTQLQSQVQDAAPGSRWTGTASEAYAAKNAKHAANIGQAAGLDKQLATEVGNSAAVVRAGRRDLDSVKQWVLDAAASVPNTKDREKLLMPIVSKGSSDVANIVSRSNADLNAIGGRVQAIGAGYQTLKGDLPQGAGDTDGKKEGDKDPSDQDDKPPVDPKQAEHDVHQVLAGQATPEELARVRNNLHLTPQQQADYDAGRQVQLSPQQQQVLGQMQAQTHGMSISDIRKAEQRLGPSDNHIVSDSLQMMSDDQFHYARVLPEPGALGSTTETSQGGVHGLPDSVQKALSKDYSFYDRNFDRLDTSTQNAHDVATLADIVRDGDPKYQHGTGLDKRMLDWSSDTLQHDVQEPLDTFGSKHDEYVQAREDAIDKVFYAAGQDHIAVHDEMAGDSGQKFLDGLHTYQWQDPSHSGSTHGLLDWIGADAASPDVAKATNAGEAAHSLATYLDNNHDKLLSHDVTLGKNSVGQYDPALVSADAQALAPFQRAMVGDSSGTHGFGDFGHPSKGDYGPARNVFAVVDSDPSAAKYFNAAAERNIMNYQNSFADAAGKDPGMNGSSPHYDDLRHAANLLGVVNGGADEEAVARGLNETDRAKAVYDIKKNALDLMLGGGVDRVPGLGNVPGIGIAQDTLETGILGDTVKNVEATHNYPTYGPQEGRDMSAFRIASVFHPAMEGSGIDADFFDPNTHQLLPPDQIKGEDNKVHYSEQLRRYVSHHPDIGSALADFDDQYNSGAGIADNKTKNPGG